MIKIKTSFPGLLLLMLLLAACQPKPAGSVSDQSATATPESQGNPEVRFNYAGIGFDLDPALASGAEGQTMPENPGSAEGPYWEILPEYVRITFNGYPLTQTALDPVLSVYPVERYAELNPATGEIIADLQNLVSQKPASVERVPYLPLINAGLVFHSNLEWLSFENGSGARYLAILAQYPAPVNNQDLFYTFQGLTGDGRHVVSMIMPVNHPSLPVNPGELSQAEMDAIVSDYDQYRSKMATELAAQPSSSFTPDLAKLDALVTSLIVKP
jgi:hypothetical protein